MTTIKIIMALPPLWLWSSGSPLKIAGKLIMIFQSRHKKICHHEMLTRIVPSTRKETGRLRGQAALFLENAGLNVGIQLISGSY